MAKETLEIKQPEYVPYETASIVGYNMELMQDYLTESQMEHNVICHFYWAKYWNAAMGYNWDLSKRGIAAVLGNLQSESSMNPGLFEKGWARPYDYWTFTHGFGNTQWTPATKYFEWLENPHKGMVTRPENHLDNSSDEWLVYFRYACIYQWFKILDEADTGAQWFRNPKANPQSPPISLKELLTNRTLTPEKLAKYFIWYYEHPANPNQPHRSTQARKWFNFLKNHKFLINGNTISEYMETHGGVKPAPSGGTEEGDDDGDDGEPDDPEPEPYNIRKKSMIYYLKRNW